MVPLWFSKVSVDQVGQFGEPIYKFLREDVARETVAAIIIPCGASPDSSGRF